MSTTDQSHRANVVGDVDLCSDGVRPDEVLVGRDNGQYLGNFASSYLASAHFATEYPVGWTNGTWYEQPAATEEQTCTCTDCRGTQQGKYVRQRVPDDEITATDAGVFDYWDHAVNPKRYTGNEGCDRFFDTSFNCADLDGTSHTGICQPRTDVNPNLDEPAGWPLVPFATANPSSRIRVVEDTSGPTDDPCVQEELALEIDFAGNGAEGATFIGEGGGCDADRCGADSSPANGYTDGERSATGWTVARDSCWTVRFWVKAVPDADGFVCEGYDFRDAVGFWPFPFSDTTIDGAASLTLTDEWQAYFRTWRADWPSSSDPEPMLNTPLMLMTLTTPPGLPTERPIYGRKGRVHVKHVSVVPCQLSAGLHLKRYSAEIF